MTDPDNKPAPGSASDVEGAETERKRRREYDMAKTRTLVARIVWAIFVIFALVMALAALLIALKANKANDFVDFVKNFANNIDLGIFDLDQPIKKFDDDKDMIKTALLSYGLGAVFYLIVGRLLERLIRP